MTVPKTSYDTDVVVVGAGPTGLATATALRQAGFEVEVIDDRAREFTQSRAAVVHSSTVEAFDAIGLAGDLRAAGETFNAFAVYANDRRLVRIDFSGLPSNHPYVITIPQHRTEQLLANRLGETGTTVRKETRLVGLTQDADSITCRVQSTSDETDAQIKARYVIGADGINSSVRTLTGIEFVGSSYKNGYYLADVRLNGYRTDDEIRLFFSPKGAVIVAKLPDDTYRVMASTEPNRPKATAAGLLRDRGPERSTVELVTWEAQFDLHKKLATEFVRGRVLLAGDSAHVHSPTGGQGMNAGIRDAISAAETLTRLRSGGDDRQILSHYNSVRRKEARHVLMFTDRAMKATTLTSPVAMKTRNTFIASAGRAPFVRHKIARRISGIDS